MPARRKPAPRVRVTAPIRQDYRGLSAGIGQSLGRSIGGMIGGPAGAGIGASLGYGAGSLFSHITGLGDYTVKKNTIVYPDQIPLFQPTNDGCILVSHKEYITDIISSGSVGAFKVDSFDVNPGLPGSFPWLSILAQAYDEWQPLGIVYAFKSTSADALNSTNTALGTVVMATEYNPLNPVYVNKQQMEQCVFSGSSRTSSSLMHPLECDFNQTREVFNIRQGGLQNGDPRLYDLGRFSIASSGLQGTDVDIGELWVTYSIKLMKPRLGDQSGQMDHYVFSEGATGTNYFGEPGFVTDSGVTCPYLRPESDLGTTLDTTNGIIYMPSTFTGNAMVYWDLQGDPRGVLVTQDPTFTCSDGAIEGNLLLDSTWAEIQDSYTSGMTRQKNILFFSCVNGGTITLSGGSLLGPGIDGSWYGDLIIAVLPSTMPFGNINTLPDLYPVM